MSNQVERQPEEEEQAQEQEQEQEQERRSSGKRRGAPWHGDGGASQGKKKRARGGSGGNLGEVD